MEVIEEVYEDEINRTVLLSQDDICFDCKMQYGCPLIECLANGLVNANDEIVVRDCAHFE